MIKTNIRDVCSIFEHPLQEVPIQSRGTIPKPRPPALKPTSVSVSQSTGGTSDTSSNTSTIRNSVERIISEYVSSPPEVAGKKQNAATNSTVDGTVVRKSSTAPTLHQKREDSSDMMPSSGTRKTKDAQVHIH